jgi:HSP20 family protein
VRHGRRGGRSAAQIGNFKSLEIKNAAPNSAAWLLHGAAAKPDCRSHTMFVLPLSRASSRSLAPHFSRAVDRLFDESFDRHIGGADAGSTTRTPALDVSETDTAYTVAFDVPGATREQLKVSVEGRRVSIETTDAPPAAAAAPVQPAAPAEGTQNARPVAAPRVLYRERSAPRYARTVSLPAEVDQAASQAKFENGVLTLTLAKKVATGATQLSIG